MESGHITGTRGVPVSSQKPKVSGHITNDANGASAPDEVKKWEIATFKSLHPNRGA